MEGEAAGCRMAEHLMLGCWSSATGHLVAVFGDLASEVGDRRRDLVNLVGRVCVLDAAVRAEEEAAVMVVVVKGRLTGSHMLRS